MKHLLLISLILLYSCHSTTSKKGQEYETDGIPQQEELCPDSISETGPISLEKEQEKSPQAISLILQPVPRDIPIGEAISTALLSMKTEYDYYPLSTMEVKITVTNYSQQEYTCGNDYSLAYYNDNKQQWETLPTDPIIEDILWVLQPEYPSGEQTIKLYTSEVPNRAGKYRIYKAFNRNTQVAYAEFELISSKQYQKLLDKIMQYDENHPKARTIENLNSWGFKENDTLYMDWKVNSAELRNEFKQKVLNYSAIMVNDGKEDVVTYFNSSMCTDTFGIKMYTEKEVYTVNTESVTARIVNRSGRTITMGTWYAVLRKEKGDKWILLPGATVWTLVELSVQSNAIHSFSASLYPSLNAITPGIYRIVKKIDIGDNCHDWYFAAEFRIGNDTEKQDIVNKEPSSKPLSEVAEEMDMDIAYEVVEEMPEYPGGMSALLDFIQNNLQHDKANSKKRVIVQFIIDERGNIAKPIILRSINPELDKEALRVVSLMPQWKPGRQNGKVERVRYTLPITFNPSIKKSDMIEKE